MNVLLKNMRHIKELSRVSTDVVVGVIGFVFGAWLVGFQNLNPESLQWLSADARIAQLGYEFFWRSPWWQFPIDATPNFGVGWGVGLNQNAHNSLLALILKSVAVFFPAGFQFQGLWIATSFALHAVIARKIFGELRLDRSAQIFGVVVVTLAPALFSRIGTLWHLQLSAHWMILLSLLMYLRNTKTRWWSFFCVCVLSVHVYLFVIVFSVALAAIGRDVLQLNSPGSLVRRLRLLLVRLGGVIVPSLVAMVVFGFGTFLTNSSVTGTGFFRMNLLAFVNPARENYGFLTSKISFFAERTWITEENEGFAYLGLGAIVAVTTLIFQLPVARVVLRRHHWPLAMAALALFVVALSDRIAIGGREFVIPVPNEVIELRQAVRASTRFAWLALYLLVVFGWWSLATASQRCRKRYLATLLLVGTASLQIVDVVPGVIKLRDEVKRDKDVYAPDLGREWSILFQEYGNVKIVPSVDSNEDDLDYLPDERSWFADTRLFQLAWIAAFNDIELNYAFCARPCFDLARTSTRSARSELSGLKLEPGTVYLFSTESEWKQAREATGASAKRIDGFFAILGPRSAESRP